MFIGEQLSRNINVGYLASHRKQQTIELTAAAAVVLAVAVFLFLPLTRANAVPATPWVLYRLSSRKPSCLSNQLQRDIYAGYQGKQESAEYRTLSCSAPEDDRPRYPRFRENCLIRLAVGAGRIPTPLAAFAASFASGSPKDILQRELLSAACKPRPAKWQAGDNPAHLTAS